MIGTLIAIPSVYKVIVQAPQEGDTPKNSLIVVKAVPIIPLSKPAIKTPIVNKARGQPCFSVCFSIRNHPLKNKEGWNESHGKVFHLTFLCPSQIGRASCSERRSLT